MNNIEDSNLCKFNKKLLNKFISLKLNVKIEKKNVVTYVQGYDLINI